jgi:glycosyltransferase involved in cell wall biosynthesis
VAVGFHRLGPYHVARLEAAADTLSVLAVERCSLDSVYGWEPVETRGLGFDRVTLAPSETMTTAESRQARRFLAVSLDSFTPHAVAIPGWSNRMGLWMLDWATARRVPVILMSESRLDDAPRRRLIEAGKRSLVALCAAALVGGSSHRSYLERLGMPEDAISLGYDAVDNGHFEAGADAVRNDAARARASLGLPEHYFLASSRFVAKKNLPGLLEAFAKYRALVGADAWSLVVLGDGPMRADIEAIIRTHCLGHSVHLMGFRQYHELPAFYGLAGAFVHASSIEQWGLVVNEAMASGLPVLVSTGCGCAPDLVVDGSNGFTFEPGDVDGLARLMQNVSSDSCDRLAMGEVSRRVIEAWGPTRFADGLVRSFNVALDRQRKGDGLAGRLLVKALG